MDYDPIVLTNWTISPIDSVLLTQKHARIILRKTYEKYASNDEYV